MNSAILLERLAHWHDNVWVPAQAAKFIQADHSNTQRIFCIEKKYTGLVCEANSGRSLRNAVEMIE